MTRGDLAVDLTHATRGLPKAASDQIDVQPFEYALLVTARHHHPTIAWWHGYRRAEERFGSYCYVCESFVVTWSGNSGPPMPARDLIDTHKLHHRAGTLPAREPITSERHPK